MGVHATWCQLCGLPVQHDHYVRSHGERLAIYRGALPGGGHDWSTEPGEPFQFSTAHAWLRDAVGLTRDARVVRGHVEDGALCADGDELYVGDGNEDALVFHHCCWELMGRPTNADAAPRGVQTLVYERLYPYQEQLFDFQRLVADGLGEWLLDPAQHDASRQRVDAVLAAARRPFSYDEPTSVAQVLEWDRDWQGSAARNADGQVVHHVQFRRGPTPRMDLSAYPKLLCFLLEFEGGFPPGYRRLQELQLEVKARLEHDGLGVVVMLSTGRGQQQLLAYVKDLHEAHRRVDALPWADTGGRPGADDAEDPAWKIFFEEMGLPPR